MCSSSYHFKNTDINITLNQLIKEAYTLFSRYKLGSDIAVCTHCCVSEDGVKELKTTPLDKLSYKVIDEYLDAAATRYDEQLINQIRYLLPKILELLVAGKQFRHSIELAFDKFYCDHNLWLDEELAFLRRFAQSYLQYKIVSSSEANLNDIIEAIVMFDNAHLRQKDGRPFVTQLFNVILKNAHKPSIIEDMIGLVHCKNLNLFASEALGKQCDEFIHSKNFKNTLITAVLDNVESDILTEDERNLYEVAFDIFMNIK